MKVVTILSLLLLASPVFGELTKEDVRTIFKEENAASEKRMKEYIDLKIEALDKSLNARIDAVHTRIDAVHTRIDAVDKRIDAMDKRIDQLDESLSSRIDQLEGSLSSRIGDMWLVVLALIGFVAAAIAIPQIIIANTEKRRQQNIEREHQDLQTEIRQLRERLEALEHTPS